jgi:hypothetical protein
MGGSCGEFSAMGESLAEQVVKLKQNIPFVGYPGDGGGAYYGGCMGSVGQVTVNYSGGGDPCALCTTTSFMLFK